MDVQAGLSKCWWHNCSSVNTPDITVMLKHALGLDKFIHEFYNETNDTLLES